MTDKEWSVLEAYRAGVAAAVSPALPSVVPGWGKSGNPYGKGTDEYKAWTLGFQQGKNQA